MLQILSSIALKFYRDLFEQKSLAKYIGRYERIGLGFIDWIVLDANKKLSKKYLMNIEPKNQSY